MPNRTDDFYPAEGAIHGYGTQLMVGNGASPEAFEAVAGVISITPGDMATEDIDRTHLRSPRAHREHMPGLRDSGEFNVNCIWLPTEQSQSNAGGNDGGDGVFSAGGAVAQWRERGYHNFKIALMDGGSPGTEWGPIRGYWSKFQPGEIGVSDKINVTMSFRPTEAYDHLLP